MMDRNQPLISRATGLRSTATALLGVLLIQAAWILVVPPFRGLDEHDHAYKAAAVARGDWQATHPPSSQGWGEFVEVPADLVIAAEPVCEALPYTTSDNCVGAGTDQSGITTVASSATRYNPVFYFVVGSAALPFHGTSALYVMRGVAALLCALLLALAVVTTLRWARSIWPSVALLLAATPMFFYTTAMAAPNGVEVAAALLLWASLLGIARAKARPRTSTAFVVGAIVAAVPLAIVRGLGPLWLLLTVLTVAPLLGSEGIRSLARRRITLVGAVIVLAATLFATAWTIGSGVADTTVGDRRFDGSPWATVPGQWVLWFFQSVAAFPARDELAPIPLYAVWLVVWWVFVAVGWRVAGARERWGLVLVMGLSTLVPVTITVTTFEALGTVWQGRYGYPYAMGFLLICGYALDRASTDRWTQARWPIWTAGAVVLVAGLIGQLTVLGKQVAESPLRDSPAWLQPSPALIVILNVAGASLLVGSLSRANNRALGSLPS